MSETKPKIRKSMIAGRELFVCDGMVEPLMQQHIGSLVKRLHYVRSEKSRAGVPGLVAVCDIAPETIPNDNFLRGLRQTVERLLPNEHFTDQRAYVNCSIYGDTYYIHRDCAPHERHVTALYYANLEWQADWGGETIYYNDDEDAEFAITPRPGRLVIARGALLHRGNVPNRNCYEERYTLAYKLNSVDPSSA
ncbi:MAG TPA: 2OG-Fe(II) oxygenase [Rhizomicrobium sp.]|nr:2OG-Fe(II) oxygenase [Rhizomicrobium sp.]